VIRIIIETRIPSSKANSSAMMTHGGLLAAVFYSKSKSNPGLIFVLKNKPYDMLQEMQAHAIMVS